MGRSIGKKIDVAYCFSDNHAGYAAVSINSLVINNPNLAVFIHVVSDYISPKSRAMIEKAAMNAQVTWHIDEYKCLDNLETRLWTKHAWFRILLPEILREVSRILYLDTDTLITGSIESLLQIDMEGFSTAGIADGMAVNRREVCGISQDYPYVCSGVLWMNLDYWRSNNIALKIIDWARVNAKILRYPDQDAINYVCGKSIVYLPLHYSAGSNMVMQGKLQNATPEEIEDAIDNPIIIHYCGNLQRPWLRESCHPYAREWQKINKGLKMPVKYQTNLSGFLLIKTRIWHLFNNGPGKEKNKLKNSARKLVNRN